MTAERSRYAASACEGRSARAKEMVSGIITAIQSASALLSSHARPRQKDLGSRK